MQSAVINGHLSGSSSSNSVTNLQHIVFCCISPTRPTRKTLCLGKPGLPYHLPRVQWVIPFNPLITVDKSLAWTDHQMDNQGCCFDCYGTAITAAWLQKMHLLQLPYPEAGSVSPLLSTEITKYQVCTCCYKAGDFFYRNAKLDIKGQ